MLEPTSTPDLGIMPSSSAAGACLPALLRTLLATLLLSPSGLQAQTAAFQPLAYTIHVGVPTHQTIDIDVVVPTGRRDSIFMMMPIWSPGMYVLQSYGDRVTAITAKAPDGTALGAARVSPSRWVVKTGGQPTVTVSYTVAARRGTNLSTGVTDTSLVIIGPATFMTLADGPRRPATVRMDLPADWKPAATSLAPAPRNEANHFLAPDYDVLADSPILAGSHLTSATFTVGGVRHRWVYLGDSEWGAEHAAAWVRPLVEEHLRFWGSLPLRNYVFLNIVTGAGPGSGVEHLNSVAINTNGKRPATPDAEFRQASFISHEYFHAMNVKRLRPVELGPFDYEHTPVTTGLWVGEGLTSYFGDLLAARSGLGTPEDYLALTSRRIAAVQNSPGRLEQTLEQASAQMFERIPAINASTTTRRVPWLGSSSMRTFVAQRTAGDRWTTSSGSSTRGGRARVGLPPTSSTRPSPTRQASMWVRCSTSSSRRRRRLIMQRCSRGSDCGLPPIAMRRVTGGWRCRLTRRVNSGLISGRCSGIRVG